MCGLFGYHTYLVATDQTTHEQLKRAWDKIAGNPYSRKNFFKSVFKLYKWHIRKSFIELRKVVSLDFGRVRLSEINEIYRIFIQEIWQQRRESMISQRIF